MKQCSIDGCENTGKLRRGWCEKHYKRYERHGDPEFIEISNRKHGMTDEELLIWIRSKPQIKYDPKTHCKEWQKSLDTAGYGTTKYKGKIVKVHRLVWKLAYGSWPNDCLLHSCDNPKCINIRHLSDGSKLDNYRDMVKKGRDYKFVGEKHGFSKLTNKKVLKIRKMHKTGRYSGSSLGRIFGISKNTIYHVLNRETWKHI